MGVNCKFNFEEVTAENFFILIIIRQVLSYSLNIFASMINILFFHK